MPRAPAFLTLDEVLALHAHLIERYGGRPGLRDVGLLQSAVATPAASFGGSYLHVTLEEMAGAYLFHLTQAHPFVDGNKRIGLALALLFLQLNGRDVEATEDDLVELMLGVASGTLTKSDAAVFLRTRTRRARRPGD